MKKRRINATQFLLALGVLFMCTVATAQTRADLLKDEKKVDKAIKIFNEKDHRKGKDKLIKQMNKFQDKHTFASWYSYNTLVLMEQADFDLINSLLILLEPDDSEEETEEETQEDKENREELSEVIESIKKSFINICRRATIESTSPAADKNLQKLLVYENPDTAISEKAQSYFDEAEEFYDKEDWELAMLNYKKAFTEDPDYYRAYLYYGATCVRNEQIDSALAYYAKAAELQPRILEARLFAINLLISEGLYYRAKKECIEAMLIYPGYNVKNKFSTVLDVENKYLNERRFLKKFYPNDMANDDQDMMENFTLWGPYRSAKDDVSKYCNDEGIIEENGEIEDTYLEVYSYRKMITENQDDLPPLLHFGDKMIEEGYLEPYVLISLFHIDIYPQFKHYMSFEENREKSKEFIDKYLIEASQN